MPKGIALSSLLFNIQINDITLLIAKLICFADGTALIVIGDTRKSFSENPFRRYIYLPVAITKQPIFKM